MLPEPPDVSQGDACPVPGCTGVMDYPPVDNCYCHLSAPCSACADNVLVCTDCSYREGELPPKEGPR